MFTKIWDEETVVAAIHGEIIAGHDVSYYATYKRIPSLLKAGERTFGSWRNAIEAAGLNYEDIKKYRTWSEERVIAVIQAHAEEGHDLSWRNTSSELDPSLAAAALNYFDDWHKALEAAGLNPELIAKYKRWSLESIEDELRLRVEEGAGVEYTSFKDKQRGILDATYRRVESFAEFRNSIVGKPARVMKELTVTEKKPSISISKKSIKRERWTKDRILEEIKNYSIQGKPLYYLAIKNENCALLRAGERHFGKWSNAVEEAGFCYDSIRLLKHWNHEKVIDRIQYWNELEENLSFTNVALKLDKKLAAAATKKTRFNSWDKALLAAGVDPETTKMRKGWTIGKVMVRLNILQEDGIELKSEVIKSYAPDLLAAVYYHVGSLSEARKMLKELDISSLKEDIETVSKIVKNDTSEIIEKNQSVDFSSTELPSVNG
jgi:hypothetical protein